MADVIDDNGQIFHLGKLPPDPVKRAAFPPLEAAAIPVLPRDQWNPINRRTLFNMGDFAIDQKSHGSCVGFSSAGALMRLRVMEGMAFQRLSGAYTYSWINGGHDDGAIISDSLTSLQKRGTCLESTVPWDRIYKNQIPAQAATEAARFRVLEAYRVDSFDQAISALQLGFIVVYAVMVGDRFMRLNGDGVSGWDAGPGNHAVHADGCDVLPSGEWFLDLPNSWGLSWGQNGRTKTTQRHWDTVQNDAYAIRAATTDPNEAQPPVAV
jgi:hypothetical protein